MEIFWSQCMLGIQTSTGASQWTAEDEVNYIRNAFFAAGSYAALENLRGKVLEEAAKMEKSHPQLATDLREKAGKMGTWLWSFLYPLAFNTALFIPGTLSPVPLVALGLYGLTRGTNAQVVPLPISYKQDLLALPLTSELPQVSAVEKGCSDLLIVRAVVKK
jgi:hypothetical protein